MEALPNVSLCSSDAVLAHIGFERAGAKVMQKGKSVLGHFVTLCLCHVLPITHMCFGHPIGECVGGGRSRITPLSLNDRQALQKLKVFWGRLLFLAKPLQARLAFFAGDNASQAFRCSAVICPPPGTPEALPFIHHHMLDQQLGLPVVVIDPRLHSASSVRETCRTSLHAVSPWLSLWRMCDTCPSAPTYTP